MDGLTSTAGQVFMSYRRDDAPGHAGRLRDGLVAYLGDKRRVFVDVDQEPGGDFVVNIDTALGRCHVFLVVIGKSWLTPRLEDPEDFVRREVEAALKRSDVTVIPVLVAGARIPGAGDLPEKMRPLVRRLAIELEDGAGWEDDLRRLTAVLDQKLPPEPRPAEPGDEQDTHKEPPPPPTPPPVTPPPATPAAVRDGIIAAALAALPAGLLAQAISEPSTTGYVAPQLNLALRLGLGWAIVTGAVVAVLAWHADRRGWQRALPLALLGGAAAGVCGALFHGIGVYGFRDELQEALDADNLREVRTVFRAGGAAITGAWVGALLGRRLNATRAGLVAGLAAGLLSGLIVNRWWEVPESAVGRVASWELRAVLVCGAALLAAAAVTRSATARTSRR